MRIDLSRIIEVAWNNTLHEIEDIGPDARSKSKLWVDFLASAFEATYLSHEDGSRYRVFWRGMLIEDPDFKIREYLHDILICETDTIESVGNQKIDVRYVTKALWQVESELKLDTREIAIDFSKLVMGSAEDKLFVMMRSKNDQRTKRMLAACARMRMHVPGNLHLCVLDHIDDWSVRGRNPKVLKRFNRKVESK